MTNRDDLSPDFVRSILNYNPETGILTWNQRDDVESAWNAKYANKEAGGPHNAGYIRVRINGISYLAHRLIWLIVEGCWPSANLDHINGNRTDNRILNLREASCSQNNANRAHRNLTGYKGVTKWEYDGYVYYNARITKNRKCQSLGYFKTPEEAHEAYINAALDIHGDFATTR